MLVSIPILLLMGTGWSAVRPALYAGFHRALLLLTAMGVRRWPAWVLGLLTLAACAQFLVGTWYLSGVI